MPATKPDKTSKISRPFGLILWNSELTECLKHHPASAVASWILNILRLL